MNDAIILKLFAGLANKNGAQSSNTRVTRTGADNIAPIGAKVSSGQSGESTNSVAGGFGPRPSFQTPRRSGGK